MSICSTHHHQNWPPPPPPTDALLTGLWDAPPGSDFRVPGLLREQPDMMECPAALRAPLVLLFWANDIDQTPPWEREETLDFAAWIC